MKDDSELFIYDQSVLRNMNSVYHISAKKHKWEKFVSNFTIYKAEKTLKRDIIKLPEGRLILQEG